MRIARAMSSPSASAFCAVHDALVTGAASSACGISWNEPRPTSESGALPESMTSGDSAASAV
ncbi:hypothetical protein D3C83_66680 [compost metagenome]